MKKNVNKKITNANGNYNRQYCKCGHSLMFLPSTEYLYCNYCGRKNLNKTKGHFNYKMYQAINEKK